MRVFSVDSEDEDHGVFTFDAITQCSTNSIIDEILC